jgi:lipopolysaccharide/colanic/teichoic acid biosynthesis glycosyltransferase
MIYQKIVKRILDILFSLIGLLLSAPVLLVVILFLYLNNRPSGVFFLQARPGRKGKIFKVIKFKTMNDKRDSVGNLLPDEIRLTSIGRFIRSTSLDELPQLINVLKGDMSLVGPRPLLVDYLPLYSPKHARRHEVRPGITGWAQIHGRNLCMLSNKFEYDVWYVDHCSFMTDILIIYKTVLNVLKKSDIGEGAANMEQVDDLHFAERIEKI